MKPLRLLCSLLLTLIISLANAQISITATDINALKGSTQTLGNYVTLDTTGLRAIINATGSGRTWNLGSRTYETSDTSVATYLNYPGGAPNASDPEFTSSTLVGKATSKIGGVSQTSWSFYKVDAASLTLYGIVNQFSGTTAKGVYSPPLLSQKLPTVFGTSWSSQTTLSTSGGQLSYLFEAVVDGEGTIVTPEGSFTCLRIRAKATTTIGGTTSTGYAYSFIDKKRTYALIGADANFNPLFVGYIRPLSVTAIEPDAPPQSFFLAQNYPNPFNPSTTIEYSLTENSHVRLAVFNALGQEVATLVSEAQPAGYHRIKFDGAGFASGVYLYRLLAEGKVKAGRMSLVK